MGPGLNIVSATIQVQLAGVTAFEKKHEQVLSQNIYMKFCQLPLFFFDLCQIIQVTDLISCDKSAKNLAILCTTGHSLISTHVDTLWVCVTYFFVLICINEHEGSFGHVNN